MAPASNTAPLKLYGQESTATTNMNMIIHDMEGEIEIGNTFRHPRFRKGNRLQTFDRVVANPMPSAFIEAISPTPSPAANELLVPTEVKTDIDRLLKKQQA